MLSSIKIERGNKFSFLKVEVIPKQGKFTTIFYKKPTFSVTYSNFESLLPSAYESGMAYLI